MLTISTLQPFQFSNTIHVCIVLYCNYTKQFYYYLSDKNDDNDNKGQYSLFQ